MKLRPKVIFVTPLWDKPRTGPEVYARYLWESFRDDPDIEFHLVAGGEGKSHPRLHLVKPTGSSLGLYRTVARQALELMLEFGSNGVLHVNNSNFHHSLLGSPWPIIGQINDYETAQFRQNAFAVLCEYGLRRFASLWRRNFLESKFVSHQAVTLCNSEFTREQVSLAYAMIGDPRMRVIHKAVDVDGFLRPLDFSRPLRVDGLREVLFVGADFRRKGLDVLIKALARLSEPVRLRVVGVVREDFERSFPSLLADATVRGSVVDFMGFVDRSSLPKVFWGADVFCMPSRSEALGVALLEAVAAGLPCVATNVGGIPEIAIHFKNVRLVSPDDPVALASVIELALNSSLDPPEIDKIWRLFGRNSMVGSVKELYLELLL